MVSIAPFSGAPPVVRSGVATRAPRWPFRIRTDLAAELGITFWWPFNAPGLFSLWRARTTPTLGGSPTLTPWSVGGATAFRGDGSSKFIDHNVTGASLGLSNAGYTIACWLEPTAIDIQWQAVWAFGEGGKPRLARQGAGTQLNWQPGGGSSCATVSGTLVVGTPHHVICTKNGNSGKIFVDGEVGSTGSAGNPDTTGHFHIGQNPDFSVRWWEGYIGDVIVAKRGWSDKECKRLFDPATRWALYDHRPPIAYSFPSVLRTRAEVDVPLGTLSFAGLAPIVTAVYDTTIEVEAAPFVVAGEAPTVSTGVFVVTPTGTLEFEGVSPTVGTSFSAEGPVETFTLSALTPAASSGVRVVSTFESFGLAGVTPNVGIGTTVVIPSRAFLLGRLAPAAASGANIPASLRAFLLSSVAPKVIARGWTRVLPASATWTKVKPTWTTWTRLN